MAKQHGFLLAWAVVGLCGSLASAGAAPAGGGKPARIPKSYSAQMITIPSGAEKIDAYLATPTKPARGSIVIVHEWWGLADWVKKVANRFAAQGSVAIAPDLYRGKLTTDPDQARALASALPEARALGDIRAAAAYVQELSAAKGKKGGVVGFCMGGGLALRAALDHGPFQATVICYGSPVTDPERLATLPGPVLGIFGAEDRGIGPDQTAALEKAMGEAGIDGVVRTYPGGGHAFLNDGRADYKPEVARQAWDEIDAFFAKQLAGS